MTEQEMNKQDVPEEMPTEQDVTPSKEAEDMNKDKLAELDKELSKEQEALKQTNESLKDTNAALKDDDKKLNQDDPKNVPDLEADLAKDKEDLKQVNKEINHVDQQLDEEIDETQALINELKAESKKAEEPKAAEEQKPSAEEFGEFTTKIFGVRTTANREDQVVDFVTTNAEKKGFKVYSIIRPHGMRGYIFMEAETRSDAEQAAYNVPYARGILPNEIQYNEIEHMLEQVKKEVNIQQNDVVEIISGPFKRENAKIVRIDKAKEEVVVELLEAAVPIPITLKLDAVKVIRRDGGEIEN